MIVYFENQKTKLDITFVHKGSFKNIKIFNLNPLIDPQNIKVPYKSQVTWFNLCAHVWDRRLTTEGRNFITHIHIQNVAKFKESVIHMS